MNEAQKAKLEELDLPEEGWYEIQNDCYVCVEPTVLWVLDSTGHLHQMELNHLGCV